MDVVFKAVLIIVGVVAAVIAGYFLWFVIIGFLAILLIYLPAILTIGLGITIGIAVGGNGGVLVVIIGFIAAYFIDKSWEDSYLFERIAKFLSSLLPGK